MRVLQVLAGAAHGGAETFFSRLVIALHQEGLNQKAIIKKNQQRRYILEKAGINVLEATFNPFFPWITKNLIKKQIIEFKPDIVLTWMSRASHFCPKGDFVHVARLGGYYNLKYYKKCDYLIGNTPDIVKYLIKENWPKKYTKFLPNFAQKNRTIISVNKSNFNTPSNVPIILGLGRLHDDKAFDVLIKALPKIKKAHLWIAGEGEKRTELIKLTHKYKVNDRVHFLGWQTNTDPLFQKADLIAFPSRVEPLGGVVLEAWMHEVPIVAAKSMGPNYLISHEENGLLVKINDIDGLAHNINKLLTDKNLCKKLVKNGKTYFNKNFTKNIIVKKYIEYLKNIKGIKRI